MLFNYQIFTSRNWAYIDSWQQKKIQNSRLLLCGCGLGSVIAEIGVRTGFEHFTIADGDTVDLSNLNRQAYNISQVDKNKAKALKENILNINQKARVKVIDHFLKDEIEIAQLVQNSDIIVNTIDFDSPVFLLLNQIARNHNKSVLFPLNIGWGGTLIVFSKDSVPLEEMIGMDGDDDLKSIYEKLLLTIANQIYIPDYMRSLLTNFRNEGFIQWENTPQLGVAAYLSSALTVNAAVKIVLNEKVKTSPNIIRVDSWDILNR